MTASVVAFDRSDPSFLDNPYPMWTLLRDRDPVHVTANGTYLVTRHEDVSRLLRERRCGREIPQRLVRLAAGSGQTTTSFLGSVLNMEGARHARLRRLMLPRFTPHAVHGHADRVAAVVDELLDRAGTGRFDLIDAVAGDLPVLVICDLLGLPREDCPVLKEHIAGLIDASMLLPTPQALARSDRANEFFAEYFERRSAGRGALLAELRAAREAGAMTSNELAANATLMLFAGNETTTNSIGNGVLALLEHPHALARLRREPRLLPAAVEELLRYDSPVQTTLRWTAHPIDLPTGRLVARRFVEVSLAAANRDPRAFDRPDELVLDREANPHVAFGHGPHLCLGAHLARLASHLVLRRLLDRYPRIEMDGPPVRLASLWNRGLTQLPLRVSA